MSALTDQWLAVEAATLVAQNGALDIQNAGLEGDMRDRTSRVAAFQAIQNANLADLDAKIKALQILMAAS